MAILKNASHERFAQLVSEGKTGTDAYLEAGHKVASRRVAGVNASRLMQRPEVKARIEEMLSRRQAIEEKATEKAIAAAVDKLALTKERVLAEYEKIAFAHAGKYFDWGPDGVTVRSKDDLTEDQMAAVSEVSQTVTEAGGTIRVKLHSKLDALEKLGRHFGLFGAKGTEDDPLNIKNSGDASPRDVARAVLDILRQASVNGEAKEEDGDAA